MASLNLSTNGPSISKSYQSVVNAPPPSGPAASSPTYGQWAVFSVTAPLTNAFAQDSGNKESVLKVQSTGEGELIDLVDEFSDGRIQFAYVKVKDSNTGLPKNALVAWCGEGVPERTKGYFTSHLTAVAKLLHGYHVQITARSDRDLTPEGIIQKVADASGSKYSAGGAPPPVAAATKPAVASKPAFTPTQSSGGSGFNPIRARGTAQGDASTDADGWGSDAPPVTRTQLEKVQSAYQPTRVDMRSLASQQPASSALSPSRSEQSSGPEPVRGAYQPVGKVDIAAIRRQAQESGNLKDDRPEITRGSYEPVGKVDIAAIRARAQGPSGGSAAPASSISPAATGETEDVPKTASLGDRSAAFSSGERLTSLPKPKIANKFGGGGNFSGTKAPLPGGFEAKSAAPAAPVGTASRTFADQGGKTPAQIWAEKKARERGASGSGDAIASNYNSQAPMAAQVSGDGEWKSGYSGRSWAAVQTTHTGKSTGSNIAQQRTGDLQEQDEEEQPSSPSGGIGSIRERFNNAPPMGAPAPGAAFDRTAPEPDVSSKPNRGIPIPGLSQDDSRDAPALPSPPPQPRSPDPPTPEMRDTSPIRVALPVSRGVEDAREDQKAPPPSMPISSLNQTIQKENDEPDAGPDPARGVAQTAAAASLGKHAVDSAPAATQGGGERAKAEYDYEAAEDNEVSLREGEIVSDIEKIDPDWWVVTNESGQKGLVPANYLVPVDDDEDTASAPAAASVPAAAIPAASEPAPAVAEHAGATAIAQYDYEAAEDNELSFPENAIIHNVSFPDDDWWHGEYEGQSGLFPSNYVELQG